MTLCIVCTSRGHRYDVRMCTSKYHGYEVHSMHQQMFDVSATWIHNTALSTAPRRSTIPAASTTSGQTHRATKKRRSVPKGKQDHIQ